MERAKRYNQIVSLILMNIDELTTINEKYGNEAGDSVIKALAAIAGNNVRSVDIPARMNGGEIAVLLPGTGSEMAVITAERLREMAENTIIPAGEEHISFTVSAGVSRILSSPFHLNILLRMRTVPFLQPKKRGETGWKSALMKMRFIRNKDGQKMHTANRQDTAPTLPQSLSDNKSPLNL
ncbi:MAG: GGDEF domain-containing protein [Desulfobacterales bacterium]